MTTFTVVQTGDWSDPATWDVGGGDYPGLTTDDDVVLINTGSFTVTYDIDNSTSGLNHRIRSITISQGETLTFATDQDTYLWIGGSITDCINSTDQGRIEIGSEGSPLSSSYTCTFEVDQSTDGSGKLIDIGNGGECEMWGAFKTIKQYTDASLTANSSTSISMTAVPADWSVSDEILVQGTDSDRTVHNEEVVTIDSKTATSIAFSDGGGTAGAAAFSHLSGCMIFNLTRNITVIATDTSSRVNYGVQGSNCDVAYLNYVDFNGCTNLDKGGGWVVQTQNGDNRRATIIGCVSRNHGNDGCAVPGAGSMNMVDCIIYNNAQRGFDSQNDSGKLMFDNCYFVGNGADGLGLSRGSHTLINCQVWGHTILGVSADCAITFINCRFFNNSDTGVSCTRTGYFHHCFFGESEAGTQSNFNAIKTEYSYSLFNDCFFASGEDFQAQNNQGILAKSSNHNQTANNYVEDYSVSTQLVESDATTYRTSAPSIKMEPGITGNFIMHEIPIFVENSTSYTITLYGKKSAASPYRDPHCKVIGCGLDDTAIWSTADTNFNSVTLTGTATRDGVATIFIWAYESEFWLDDVTVA